ncbi:MAG TPA: hypothetical protein VK477_03415, partial [Acidobacteriota bacterium]|nr:hypothetical protein [Acidobacteriota bacterium]
GVTGIRVSQYASGAFTTLLDQQIIPIVVDNAASPATVAVLTNTKYVVPSTSNTGGFLYANASTEMRVYVGGVDDTANWTFSVFANTGSSTGGFGATSGGTLLTTGSVYGNGPGYNRYWLTGISTTAGTTTGTVTLRASKGGTNLDRVFTWVKQTSTGISPNNDQSHYEITAADTVTADPFKIYYANTTPTPVPASALFVAGSNTPWFDGITVYVHSVDAESATGKVLTAGVPARLDSGVRLLNGRGPAVSITASGYTGFSFTTNDALYILGHFNADGTINSTTTSTTNPGGYSGRYPESSSEYLTAVMADAITILSQPEYAQSGTGSGPYTYTQSVGWCDALSGNTRSDQGTGNPYSTSWQTSNPSTSNSMEGTNQTVYLTPTPFQGTSTSGASTSNRDYKFPANETEVSACLLTGIVETTSHQHSGGVHNYPRLLEQWSNSGTQVGLYIRGSMVAMFASEVATEPWSIRIYTGAGRFWGLHESLRDEHHDVPLEPILLSANRKAYKEIRAQKQNSSDASEEDQYAELKTTILGL